MLRLGTKYEISHIRTDALGVLIDIFPCTLEAFDAKYPDSLKNGDDCLYFHEGLFTIFHTCQVLNLPFLLPGILLRVTMDKSLLDILDSKIDTPDLKLLIKARDRLFDGYEASLRSWLSTGIVPADANNGKGCKGREECISGRGDFLQNELSRLTHHIWDDILPQYETIKGFHSFRSICKYCKPTQEVYNAGRQQFWNEIPSYLGLDSWESLINQRDEGVPLLSSSLLPLIACRTSYRRGGIRR